MNRYEITQGVMVVDRHHWHLVTPIVGALYMWFRHPVDGWRPSPVRRATRDAGIVAVRWSHLLDEVDEVDDVEQNPVLALIRSPIPGSTTGRVDVPSATDRINDVVEALRDCPFGGEVVTEVPVNLVTVQRARDYRREHERRRSQEVVDEARRWEKAESRIDRVLKVAEARYGMEVSDPVRNAMVRQAVQVDRVEVPLSLLEAMCDDLGEP